MEKRVLIDTNILIDYSEGVKYATKFFNEAKIKYYQIFILEDVYAEAKTKAGAISKIKVLIEELIKCDIFNRVKITDEEKRYSEDLGYKCVEVLGYDLDRTDKRLIAIARKRNFVIFSADKDLIKIAKIEKIKVI